VEPSVGVERNFVPVIGRDDLVAQAIAADQMNIGALQRIAGIFRSAARALTLRLEPPPVIYCAMFA